MNSFRTRLVWSCAALVAALAVALSALALLLASQHLRADLDRLLRDRAYILSRSVAPAGMNMQPWMEGFLETDKLGLRAQVLDTAGRVRSQSANLPAPLPLSDAAKNAVATTLSGFTETITAPDGETLRLATVPITTFRDGRNDAVGYAQAALPLRARDDTLRVLALWLGAGALAATLAAFLVARLLAGRWLRAVDAAASSARRISEQGRLNERLFVPPDDDEPARLARAFNDLLDRLETAHTDQQRFLADASHELRTPLTILRGEIEVALRRDRAAADYRAVLESCREEIERLTRLTDNLLALARADAGEALATRETVALADAARRAAEALAPLAEKTGVFLALELDPAPVVRGDPVALERLAANLLENALRYSPPGETATVRVRGENGQAVLEVADTGPGIGAEHLPRLFDRFYRVDKARSRQLGGSGLGLAIVKSLAEAHGGSVSAASEIGRGSVFTVRLPSA
jgi:heavy metal sensor kinase